MTKRTVVRRALLPALAGLLLFYVALVGMKILWPYEFPDLVARESERNGLDLDLVAAVIYAESRFRPDAVSSRGAIGLMQIMPETGAWIAGQLGVDDFHAGLLFDVETNLAFGTWYLRYLLDRFDDVETALRAYNAGPSAADRWRSDGETPYAETIAYVRRIRSARPIYRFYVWLPAVARITPPIP
jgi:soluble lytic murein transglycosylase